MPEINRTETRKRRHTRVRRRVIGTAERPRLSVFKSSKHIYAQVIDDSSGHSICGLSTLSISIRDKVKDLKGVDAAKEVGKAIAELATQKSVTKVVFDRGGFPYTGRVKALADSAREAGLQF